MTDVPSPIDFHDPVQVEQWVCETVQKRPHRPDFFAAFVRHISECYTKPISILEIGSGPGFLAEAILKGCNVASYALLDFSEAMHTRARQRLLVFADRTDFLTRDFKAPNWDADIGPVDLVVTMQAVHELRHTRHVPTLYEKIHNVLPDGGLFMVCDHYADGPSTKNPDLFMSRAAQKRALMSAGFDQVVSLLDMGKITLLCAQKRV